MKTIIGSIELEKDTRALIVFDEASKTLTAGEDELSEGLTFDDEQDAREHVAALYKNATWAFVEVVEPLEYTDQNLIFTE